MIQGPNVKKLIIWKVSYDAIPNGQGLAAAMGFLSSAQSIASGIRKATEWVEAVITVVRSAPDNPYKSDEEIAGAILKKIEEVNTRKKE